MPLTRIAAGSVLLLLALGVLPAFGQDDEDEDSLPPGLVAKYSSGGTTVERIDRDIQFLWVGPRNLPNPPPKDPYAGWGSPDPRLPVGPFEATWTGKLLVRTSGKHRLHAYGLGSVTVLIDGKPVIPQTNAVGMVDGPPVELEFGEHSLEVRYVRDRRAPLATIKLFWSAESFPLEPIPPQVLFHDKGREDLDVAEKGGHLYDTLRCGRCHVREDAAAALPAPSLGKASSFVDFNWIVSRLQEKAPADTEPAKRLGHSMPDFGFSEADATDVAAFLHSISRSTLEGTDVRGDAREGEVLFRSVGCLACHTHQSVGQEGAAFGGDLTQLAKKRSRQWLMEWLERPQSLQPQTQMPKPVLTDKERADVVAFLIPEAKPTEDQKAAAGNVEKGQALFAAARCNACHRTSLSKLDENPSLAEVPRLHGREPNLNGGCLSDTPDAQKHVPHYPLTGDDRTALRAFLKTRTGQLVAENRFDAGRRLLTQKNCLGCHDRDGQRGLSSLAASIANLDPALSGQSEALIPPDLTAVGDKLLENYLALAVTGKQTPVRLPWLKVRMPHFDHSPAELDALQVYLVFHDRVGADVEVPDVPVPPTDPRKKPETRPGERLLGSKGFNCSACHRIGTFEPRNTALGTRGSNLHGLASRMRFSYFLRWTRSPLRIVPGMEMPSYEKPVKGVLNDNLDQQLAAMWRALNEKLPPVIDGSSVEQVLALRPGDPAVIVRDVFRIGEAEPQTWVPRSFVVGFDNGQNLLFDLDLASVRLWWGGDLARQRTLGKTWLWEPGATVLPPAGPVFPDLVLKDAQGRIFSPERDGLAFGRLRSYRVQGSNVELHYELSFPIDKQTHRVDVHEVLTPGSNPAQPHEWQRRLVVVPPAGLIPMLVRAPNEVRFGAFGPEPVAPQPPVTVSVTFREHKPRQEDRDVQVPREGWEFQKVGDEYRFEARYGSKPSLVRSTVERVAVARVQPEPVTVVPGYEGVRLPLDRSIMPTAITWRADGTLAICSLKGQVFLAKDTDGDGLEDTLTLFEDGLAAPYGLIADGNDLIVAHKPELLRLKDTDGDGRADVRQVLASGWGYTDNYHDWTCGIVRDSQGNLYVGLGSDYADPNRDRAATRWRGTVLKVDREGKITPMGHGFRYPTGLAITPDDQVFVSDNQGVQNTFNEINHLVEGGLYGVPSLADDPKGTPVRGPALQVPHPWTRSVNGLFFLPPGSGPLAGQGIGCEYDSRFLIRFSLQKVGEEYQGAAYTFSNPPPKTESEGFLGTLSGAISPKGEIYVGSIYDSGWLGGPNVGDVVRLKPRGELPLGIQEARIWKGGFDMTFTGPVNRDAAALPENYSLSAYTRKWGGAYATPDTGRHPVKVTGVEVAPDGRSVRLTVDELQTGYVYEITAKKLGVNPETPLWPDTAHYTINRVP